MKLGKRPLFNPLGRIFVIGDVHGECKKLKSLLDKIKQDLTPEDHIVFVGDLVDVGPDTPGVLKVLQELKDAHPHTFYIYGNHEEMMISAMRGHPGMWFANNGVPTLKQFENYCDDPADVQMWLEDNNVNFFKELIPYYETEEVLVTHAPLPNKLGLFMAIEEGVLENLRERIRWNFVDHEKVKIEGIDKLLVCGHQNKLLGEHRMVGPRFYPEKGRIFIDGGAGYKKDAPLCCAIVFPFDQIKLITSD